MDCCLSYANPKFSFPVLSSGVTNLRPGSFGLSVRRRQPLTVVANTSSSSSSTSKFEYGGGLNTPLEPRSAAGRFLAGALLDDRDSFDVEARKELERLGNERDEALARSQLSVGSNEACLYWRIAELKKQECRVAVEEIMYMLVLHKFSEIRVHLVPRLSKCVYNGRLEIWPSKDWELESIHSSKEVLEMVREHVAAVVGSRANSVTHSWAITEIQRLRLCNVYAASILYGYFLKSASFRHQLEWGVGACRLIPAPDVLSLGSEYISFGRVSVSPCCNEKQQERGSLRCYLMGFDLETIQMYMRPKSKEALNLIERHSRALFGDEETGLLGSDELIFTSFASLKRFVLEAVAFGSFLWDAENQVSDVYMLQEN